MVCKLTCIKKNKKKLVFCSGNNNNEEGSVSNNDDVEDDNDIEMTDNIAQDDKDDDEFEAVSKLDLEIQFLIKLIFSKEIQENTMNEFELDIKKCPLGKLTNRQINRGYKILDLINNNIIMNRQSR